ncbi:MAG: hypothetical protein LIP02_08175 [Bacteroidales bacterium]|nr:hypothetical protein [Bacteroidales bacterium]
MKQLKHWLLAILVIPALAIGVTACGGDDDDDEPSSSNSLEGYWLNYEGGEYDIYYFASDGTGWNIYGANRWGWSGSHMTWKKSGSTVTIKDYGTYTETYTYRISGDYLYLDSGDTDNDYVYERITKSELPVSLSDIDWDD